LRAQQPELDDRVVLRMRWTGELAIDVGAWDEGAKPSAWSVAHYRMRRGLITEIEQHDCYEAP
jgi:hypothetical protein